MPKRKMFLIPLMLCLASFACSPTAKQIELDPSRACAPELAPDGDRSEALERLLNGNRSGNACYAS